MSKIIEVVRDQLEIRNVEPNILDKVPLLVELAIIDLQSKTQLLPPKIWEFKAIQEKNEKRDTDHDVFFEYIFLPKDFNELRELFIYDAKDSDTTAGFPYQRIKYENYINKLKTDDRRKFFAITDMEDSSGDSRKVLILNPYPDDEIYMRIKYFVDGSEDSHDIIKPRHWNVIIKHVEGQLGIRSEEDVRDAASEESSNWRNQEGKSSLNGRPRKTSGTFFGNTSRYRNKKRLR